MIRVRFHGRGGHGVKTASRILGTAAFRAGFQCQDSPIYGAERRGAAVAAFTRIDTRPILERGVIVRPDLVLVADETLLNDPTAGVLQGQESAKFLFVNAAGSPSGEELGRRLATGTVIAPRLATLDLSEATHKLLGRSSALSSPLAAVAARLVGSIGFEPLESAILEELSELELPDEVARRNVELARWVYEQLDSEGLVAERSARADSPEARHHPADRPEAEHDEDRVIRLPAAAATAGAPSVLNTGNAGQRHTGWWRVERPVIDPDICTRCGVCLVVCPDGAIALDAEGYPVIDYDHCKGCMICRQRCPLRAIELQRETRAW